MYEDDFPSDATQSPCDTPQPLPSHQTAVVPGRRMSFLALSLSPVTRENKMEPTNPHAHTFDK